MGPYKLSIENSQQLIHEPETGMGYQIITGVKDYVQKEYFVFNTELAFEKTGDSFNIPEDITLHLQAGNFKLIEKIFETLSLTNIKLKNHAEYLLAEKNEGAKDANPEPANGDELFVRLSAFENDKRVDKKNKCLWPGSFTTTASDELRCKVEKDNPNERYALPNVLQIEWAFYIQPKSENKLQRGIVQKAFEKRGGGREVYFDKGTSFNTFITESKWQL